MSNDELKDLLIGLSEDWTLAAIRLEHIKDLSASAAYDNCAQDLLAVISKLEKA